jgi:hypothetical protein
MKILAIEHEEPDATASDYAPHLAAEAKRLWDLRTAGVVREAYFRTDRDEAILVLECESCDAAERVLETLPLVKNGLISFELIPLRAYPGFARLFAPDVTA